MMEEILKYILLKNSKGKRLNKDDIRKICYIIIKRMKYEKMVRRILFEKRNDNINDVASFDGEDLIFYVDNSYDLINNNYQKLKNNNIILDGGIVGYFNFEILNTIFHEFAHIRQDYLVCRRINNKEAEIYQICYEIIEKIKGFYKQNYEIVLTEVNAFHEGMLKSFNIYKNAPLDIVSKNDKEILARLTFDEILNDYNYLDSGKLLSSSEALLEILEYHYSSENINTFRLREIIEQNNFSLYDRLKLGFPITDKEYHYLKILYDNIPINYNFVKKIKK